MHLKRCWSHCGTRGPDFAPHEYITKAVFNSDPASIVESKDGLNNFHNFVKARQEQHSKVEDIFNEIRRAYIKVYGFPVWVEEEKKSAEDPAEAAADGQTGIHPLPGDENVARQDAEQVGRHAVYDSPQILCQLVHGKARFRVSAKTGVYERIMHGTKGYGIISQIEEVSLEDYPVLRNAHDFNDVEKMTYEEEIF
ncbi:hypothetical protein VTN77DRAFT_1446 [Rasamsonia byssochlamydoides]|uniref:uncharacterized protein n=1 Tax=Rasamsonia byssochlamydoides TaxID=89139 RepID=UPI003744684A